MSKYTCPPQSPSGAGTFSDALVGLQLTQGGGLTLANFAFSNKFVIYIIVKLFIHKLYCNLLYIYYLYDYYISFVYYHVTNDTRI